MNTGEWKHVLNVSGDVNRLIELALGMKPKSPGSQ